MAFFYRKLYRSLNDDISNQISLYVDRLSKLGILTIVIYLLSGKDPFCILSPLKKRVFAGHPYICGTFE
jgi:hypothetical protein